MLMKIKRESTEVENMYLPEFKTFKKKRSIEKGRLSIFIIGGFLLLFLGLLTFEFRYLSFEDNASENSSQQSSQDTYKSKRDKDSSKKFSILKFFKKENNQQKIKTEDKSDDSVNKSDDSVNKSDDSVNKSDDSVNKSVDSADQSVAVIKSFKAKIISLFSKKEEREDKNKFNQSEDENKFNQSEDENEFNQSEDENEFNQSDELVDKSDNSAKKKLKNRVTGFSSKKDSAQKSDTNLESAELIETSQDKFFDKNLYKYSLQIMAVEEEYKKRALKITKRLVQEGYQAYTYKTPVRVVSKIYPNGKYFYRIRVGFFQTRDEAKKIGDKIFQTNSSFPNDYYVIKAKSGEYDGKVITYGFQKNQ